MKLRSLDNAIKNNGLMLIVLSFLFMPYGAVPGTPALTTGITFALFCYARVRRFPIRLIPLIMIPLILFCAYDLFFVLSDGFNFSLFRAYLFGLLSFLCVLIYLNKDGVRRMLWGIYVWFLLSFILSLAQNVAGEFFYVPLWFGYFGGINDCSLFNHCLVTTSVGFSIAKTQFALQLAFFIPLFFVFLLGHSLKPIQKNILVSVQAVLLFVIFSRSAWGAVFVALCLLVFFDRKAFLKPVFSFGVVFLIAYGFSYLEDREYRCVENCEQSESSYYIQRGKGLAYSNKDIIKQHSLLGGDHSASLRPKLIRIGFEMALDNIQGGGPGVFRNNYSTYFQKLYPKEFLHRQRMGPHNNYILILVEKGIIGFCLFLFVLGAIAYQLFKKIRLNDEMRLYYIGIFASFVSVMAYSVFHVTITDRIFWFCLALATAAIREDFFEPI